MWREAPVDRRGNDHSVAPAAAAMWPAMRAATSSLENPRKLN